QRPALGPPIPGVASQRLCLLAQLMGRLVVVPEPGHHAQVIGVSGYACEVPRLLLQAERLGERLPGAVEVEPHRGEETDTFVTASEDRRVLRAELEPALQPVPALGDVAADQPVPPEMPGDPEHVLPAVVP